MTRRRSAALPVVVSLLAMLCGRSALAGEGSCSAITVEADAAVNYRWPGLTGRIRDAFDARDDVDSCARVTLTVRDAVVDVKVTLLDGRVAARSVSRVENIVPTLEALLVVPRRDASAAPEEAQPESAPPSPNPSVARAGESSVSRTETPFRTGLVAPERDQPTPANRSSSSAFRIELSVATGGRIGDGQVSLGAGAQSFLELSGWLVGFEGRLDRYRMLTPGPHDGGALELAVLAGRRFPFQNVALDLFAGPAAALQGTATETRLATSGKAVSESSSSTVPRGLVDARVTFGARSPLRTFVSVEGDFGPSRMGSTDVSGASRLPIWTMGLALGATVGTL